MASGPSAVNSIWSAWLPEPVHQDHELESRMRENRLSGLGGGDGQKPFSITINVW
jgi:hypothetical protein